jgi:uncharacterized protein (DUF1501 family)
MEHNDNTDLDRRDFLQFGALGAGALSIGPNAFGLQLPTDLRVNDDRILVVVQMSGGNDGLNTVIPFDDDDYHRVRSGLRQRKHLKIADGVALHEQMTGMRDLFANGDLAVVQGVGYPGPNRSHFKSMDIWHSADASNRAKTMGWLGRLADLATAKETDPDFTVNIAERPPLALTGRSYRPISFRNAGAYRFAGEPSQMKAFKKIASIESRSQESARDGVLGLLGRTAADARTSSDAIRRAATNYKTPVDYGRSQLGRSLRTTASLIHAGLSTRVYYLYHNGFDTHVNQAQRHGRLLQELSSSLTAFQKDLARTKNADRVVTLAYSEFGRRVKENASRGTDHGTAGPSFVVGTKVKGAVLGDQPSLTALSKGDLVFGTDFRRIYASLIDDWLGMDSKAVLGGAFETLPLFQA